jgi:glycerophosphoryl diester phosphodiesterase
MAAFTAAIRQGADFLELDVRLSRDNIPVVIHDPTIDRTTAGSGTVGDLPAAELEYYGIPSLDAVLALGSGKLFFNIELKETCKPQILVGQVLAAIDRRNGPGQVLISSAESNLLSLTKREQPAIFTGLIFETRQPDIFAKALDLQVNSLHPYFRLIDRRFVSDACKIGFYIIPWTVDRTLYLHYFSKIGVNGIITNCPGSAIEALYHKN